MSGLTSEFSACTCGSTEQRQQHITRPRQVHGPWRVDLVHLVHLVHATVDGVDSLVDETVPAQDRDTVNFHKWNRLIKHSIMVSPHVRAEQPRAGLVPQPVPRAPKQLRRRERGAQALDEIARIAPPLLHVRAHRVVCAQLARARGIPRRTVCYDRCGRRTPVATKVVGEKVSL